MSDHLDEMGSSDQYLLKKLKECGVTLETLDQYQKKLYLVAKTTDEEKDSRTTIRVDKSSVQGKPIFQVIKEELKQKSDEVVTDKIDLDENQEMEFQCFLQDAEVLKNDQLCVKAKELASEYQQSKIKEMMTT